MKYRISAFKKSMIIFSMIVPIMLQSSCASRYKTEKREGRLTSYCGSDDKYMSYSDWRNDIRHGESYAQGVLGIEVREKHANGQLLEKIVVIPSLYSGISKLNHADGRWTINGEISLTKGKKPRSIYEHSVRRGPGRFELAEEVTFSAEYSFSVNGVDDSDLYLGKHHIGEIKYKNGDQYTGGVVVGNDLFSYQQCGSGMNDTIKILLPHGEGKLQKASGETYAGRFYYGKFGDIELQRDSRHSISSETGIVFNDHRIRREDTLAEKVVVGAVVGYTGLAVLGAADCLVGGNKYGSCGGASGSSSGGGSIKAENSPTASASNKTKITNNPSGCSYKIEKEPYKPVILAPGGAKYLSADIKCRGGRNDGKFRYLTSKDLSNTEWRRLNAIDIGGTYLKSFHEAALDACDCK